jgi:hypothetical protein
MKNNIQNNKNVLDLQKLKQKYNLELEKTSIYKEKYNLELEKTSIYKEKLDQQKIKLEIKQQEIKIKEIEIRKKHMNSELKNNKMHNNEINIENYNKIFLDFMKETFVQKENEKEKLLIVFSIFKDYMHDLYPRKEPLNMDEFIYLLKKHNYFVSDDNKFVNNIKGLYDMFDD